MPLFHELPLASIEKWQLVKSQDVLHSVTDNGFVVLSLPGFEVELLFEGLLLELPAPLSTLRLLVLTSSARVEALRRVLLRRASKSLLLPTSSLEMLLPLSIT